MNMDNLKKSHIAKDIFGKIEPNSISLHEFCINSSDWFLLATSSILVQSQFLFSNGSADYSNPS